jgi:SynChlorMet cassette radical SAM/SPASM protein ScmE
MNRPLMKTPRSVDLVITDRCNLRCSYCSHFGSDGAGNGDLAATEWLSFFLELARCTVLDVCIQGGEPLIREDLSEIIDGIVRNRMRFSLLTNGTLLTRDMASFLARTRRCNRVQVSLDGSQPDIHDGFRGKGTFQAAIEAIVLLREYHVPVSVRVTVHRNNVMDLPAVAALLLDELGLESFSTNAAANLGLCRHNRERVQLTVEERNIAMEALVRLAEQYPGRIEASAGPLAEAGKWLQWEFLRTRGEHGIPGGGCLSGCNGPFSKLAVRADGVIVPCVQLPSLELGRINESPIDRIWQSHPVLDGLRRRSDVSLRNFASCSDCGYLDFCSGGCPALPSSEHGNPGLPDSASCYRRFVESGGRLPDPGACATGRQKKTSHQEHVQVREARQ